MEGIAAKAREFNRLTKWISYKCQSAFLQRRNSHCIIFEQIKIHLQQILIIDDEEKLSHLLARIIRLEGFEVSEAPTAKAGLKRLQVQAADIVLCDVKLPDANGVELVKEIRTQYPATEVILLTAYGNIADGVQAMRNGAFDYITKGNDNDKIIPLIYRALEKKELQKRVEQLEKAIQKKYDFSNIIGSSGAIEQAINLARKVAPTEANVLLLGETGTGKEVFAQSIHQSSNRAGKPFLAINCSGFGKEILESELFGHKAGAFTGAVKDKKGLMEEAAQGTLFLDEIGEMPIELQAKLLRVLEAREFMKVGDTKVLKADVRIIAATNRNLQQQIADGHFREDLYYRLNVFSIELPALRDRKKDIAPLAQYFLEQFALKANTRVKCMSQAFVRQLEVQPWKGNIRELKNILERAVILADREELQIDLLPAEMQLNQSAPTQLSAFDLASVEKLHIQRVLIHTKGNKTETARLLNIGLSTLYRKMDEYGL